MWHLLCYVECHSEQDDLQSLMESNQRGIMVSDGSFLVPTFLATFGWVIATGNRVLWSGKCQALGSANYLHLDHAETIGGLASFLFLQLYSTFRQCCRLNQWSYYCDNLGFIILFKSKFMVRFTSIRRHLLG